MSNSFKKLVGDRIASTRESTGMTQAQLAAAMIKINPDLNVDRTRISRWESGHNLPTGIGRIALLHALRASEDSIFGLESKVLPIKTVGEMPIDEFKAALSAMSAEESELLLAWRAAKNQPISRAMALLYLFGDEASRKRVSEALREPGQRQQAQAQFEEIRSLLFVQKSKK